MGTFVQSCLRSNTWTDEQYVRLVRDGLPWSEVARFSYDAQGDDPSLAEPNQRVRLWALPAASADDSSQIQPGDTGLFYGHGHVFQSFHVRSILRFADHSATQEILGTRFGAHVESSTPMRVMIIDDLVDQHISKLAFSALLEHADEMPDAYVTRFVDEDAERVLRRLLTGKSDHRDTVIRRERRSEWFVFPWKPAAGVSGPVGPTPDGFEAEEAQLRSQGHLDSFWVVRNPRTEIRENDFVALLKIGMGKDGIEEERRGIVRIGVVTGAPTKLKMRPRQGKVGVVEYSVPIRWTSSVPSDRPLPIAQLMANVPGVQWKRFSLPPLLLQPSSGALLAALWDDYTGVRQEPSLPDLSEAAQAEQEGLRVAGRAQDLRKGQGYRLSAQHRALIERAAVERAVEFFEAQGWQVEDCGATQSYDLHCTREDEILHVEVKGSTTPAETVILTGGEVQHHRSAAAKSALFVVSHLRWIDSEREGLEGGQTRVVMPWHIEDHSLRATQYQYVVPVEQA